MKITADLHLHSSYSRATSKNLTVENLEKYARIKGIDLLGTGDFTHPNWLKDLKSKLTEDGTGFLKTKTGFPFVLQAEVSNIYSQDGKLRKVHNIILAKDFFVVNQINALLSKKGKLESDGRPIFGKYSCIELVEDMQKIDKSIEVIPAHCWTPWFSIFGSMSGFDSVEECFGDKAKHIHALETGLSCYDEETDILTDNGWKKVSDVKYNDKVCTLNNKNKEIEFQQPRRIFKYNYNGKMYRLKTKRIDLLVTPNHKLFVTTCDFRTEKPFFLKDAEALFGKSKQFKKDGTWIGEEKEYFILPSVKIKHGSRYYKGIREKKQKIFLMSEWLKFFGFWIAEGWTTEGKNGDYNVCVSNTNEKLIFEMKQILESFGYTPFYHKKGHTLRVRDCQLFHYLKQFGKCYDKFMPQDIKLLSKQLLKILLNYYIKGDGHIYGRNGKGLSATTTSIKLRDDLQEIALKLGMSAYYKLHNKKGTPFKSPGQNKIYKQRNDSWVIYFIRHNKHAITPSSLKKFNHIEKWVDFDGKVYCVSVPNQIVYVRRNGIPVWCGNSDPSMNWRLSQLDRFTLVSNSDSHSFWPWRMGREANIFDIKPDYDSLITALRTKRGMKGTIEVDPAYGKYHFDGHRACNICMNPSESLKKKNICPVCGRTLTIGVLHRVEQLADRPEGFKPKNAVPFHRIIPLHEILSLITGTGVASKKTWEEYNKLLAKFGSEMNILLQVPAEELKKTTSERIAEAIIKNREGKIEVKPGCDGLYGIPLLGAKSKTSIQKENLKQAEPKKKKGQLGLDGFI